jgi:hypothetical protein
VAIALVSRRKVVKVVVKLVFDQRESPLNDGNQTLPGQPWTRSKRKGSLTCHGQPGSIQKRWVIFGATVLVVVQVLVVIVLHCSGGGGGRSVNGFVLV